MDFRWILNRVKNIIVQPAIEWKTIRDENTDYNYHVKSFALPLIIALSVATIINLTLLHRNTSVVDAFLRSEGVV